MLDGVDFKDNESLKRYKMGELKLGTACFTHNSTSKRMAVSTFAASVFVMLGIYFGEPEAQQVGRSGSHWMGWGGDEVS